MNRNFKHDQAVYTAVQRLLRDHDEPADYWEVAQESGLPEQDVAASLETLAYCGLVVVNKTANGTNVVSVF